MPGPWQIAVVVLLALLLFGGKGKISAIMGDFAQGLKSFRKGLADDDEKTIDDQATRDKETVDADVESTRSKQETK